MTTPGGLSGWEPHEETADDVVPAAAVVALHGLLDAPGPPPGPGQPLPPLWHWMAFLPRVAQRELGADGHPQRGSFLPPVSLPRRMFAGGRLRFDGPLPVGGPIRRRGTVDSVEAKNGRSGELVFVQVDYELSPRPLDGGDDLRPAVAERQDIVYRAMTPMGARPAPPPAGSEDGPDAARWHWGFELDVDATMLFRFSALTYNAHRIHYDRGYATEIEGYPGLVVQGPLQAVALADLCRRHLADHPLATFRFRSVAPAFDDGPLRLRGRLDGDSGMVELVAFDHAGRSTMQAQATVNPEPGASN